MANAATERDRAALVQQVYGEFADPETGQLSDPLGFQNKVVQEMYRYGDVDGIKQFTSMQKENALYDRTTKQMKRQESADDLDMVGSAAFTLSEMYENLKKSQNEEAAKAYIQRVYPVQRDLLRKAGFGDYMSDEYDHETAQTVGRQWAHRKGKEFSTKAPDEPSDIKTFRTLFPGVDPGTKAGREQYFQWKRQEKQSESAPKASTAKTKEERLADNLVKNIDREYYANKKAIENDWMIDPAEKSTKLQEIESARAQAYQDAAARIDPKAHGYFYELTGVKATGGAPAPKAAPSKIKVPKAKVKFLN